ncbi:MAG: hypothetical protein AAB502_07325 [Chloroflexota bacterium]
MRILRKAPKTLFALAQPSFRLSRLLLARLEHPRHLIEGVGKGAHLARPVWPSRARGEVAAGDPRRGADEPLNGTDDQPLH